MPGGVCQTPPRLADAKKRTHSCMDGTAFEMHMFDGSPDRSPGSLSTSRCTIMDSTAVGDTIYSRVPCKCGPCCTGGKVATIVVVASYLPLQVGATSTPSSC